MQEKSRQIEFRRHAAVIKNLQDLSAEGKRQVDRWAGEVRHWALPDKQLPIFCSPTRRARATASQLMISTLIAPSLSGPTGIPTRGQTPEKPVGKQLLRPAELRLMP